MEIKELMLRIEGMTSEDDKSLVARGLKCSEEVGELAQAILSFSNVSACGYKGLTQADVVEEAIDVIVVALSIISQVDGNDAFDEVLESKLAKWQSKLDSEKL